MVQQQLYLKLVGPVMDLREFSPKMSKENYGPLAHRIGHEAVVTVRMLALSSSSPVDSACFLRETERKAACAQKHILSLRSN